MSINKKLRRTAVGTLAALFSMSTVAQTVPSTVFTYNTAGQVSQVTRPMGQVHAFQYDLDGQLVTHSQPNPGAPGTLGLVQYGFNAQGDLTSVTDPRNLTTGYAVNGFGEASNQSSPDTGTTSYTRDVAGRVTSRANARGSAAFTYDALDRMTSADYGDFSASFGYDGTPNGIGHLTSMTDPSGSTAWGYDKLGRVTSKSQTTAGVSLSAAYTYGSGGRVTSITYPSGAVVTFSYNGAQVSSIAVNGTTVISNVVYAPFGAPASWTMGAIGTYSRTLDGYGRVRAYTYDGGNRTLEWDNASRLTALNNPDGSRWTYTYDNLDRLTSASETAARGFQYDLNGNRTAESVNGTTFSYSGDSASNRLGASASPNESRSYAYDGVGNIVSDGVRGFTWNNAGYLTSSTGPAGSASYAYNGFGQRVKKTSAAGARHFFYAEDGVSLLGEYGSSGSASAVSETVYIAGIPVMLLRGGSVFYVLPDHLNTPRVVKNSVGTTVWRWHSDAFGVAGPNENPGGVALFNWNARFPGQYFDAETGLHYNNARYYDAATGRYYSSDPIGLAGGLNTFAYAGAQPTSLVDPSGNSPIVTGVLGALIGAGVNGGIAYANGENWREAALKGALSGGVAGLTLGYGAPYIGNLLSSSVLGGVASGGIAGAASGLAVQGYENAIDSRCGLDFYDVARSAALGALMGSFMLRPGTQHIQQVSSWARKGHTPDLAPGRWVMAGGPTLRNYVATGAPMGRGYPLDNFTTDVVLGARLSYPKTLTGNLEGIVGQRWVVK